MSQHILDSQLDELAQQFVSVEKEMKEIAEQMKKPCDAETLSYLRNKEVALRNEKVALRNKEVEIMKNDRGSLVTSTCISAECSFVWRLIHVVVQVNRNELSWLSHQRCLDVKKP